ncbi:SubName: Full=Uncharacterized protein {ECO:0000313/EMBL:CCA74059.1} [Serendipita indica DSM 11827]|uniref:Uncharacterized protein n=1 Tax=Serendipita indica (strain DSM 11827) TaxID=1109443 RepID=G4TRW6_SERID|nr:SubName: Full=Uncharacterized protein {ECO:0000313/EMBL:CCA74059.1} [Serendipita indica DSM 11827]CCA74059.1 hypothetical protein PIIN_08013 [Serendipita indica DSM 11827]
MDADASLTNPKGNVPSTDGNASSLGVDTAEEAQRLAIQHRVYALVGTYAYIDEHPEIIEQYNALVQVSEIPEKPSRLHDFIDILPSEISLKIITEALDVITAEHLLLDRLLALTLVSRRWAKALCNAPSLWGHILLAERPGLEDAMAGLVTALTLSRDSPIFLFVAERVTEWDVILPVLQPHAKRIVSIHIIYGSNSGPFTKVKGPWALHLIPTLLPLDNLKVLDVGYAGLTRKERKILKSCLPQPAATTIVGGGWCDLTRVADYTKCEGINMRYSGQTMEEVSEILGGFTAMTSLRLSSMGPNSNGYWSQSETLLPQLQSLFVDAKVPEELALYSMQASTNIVTLEVSLTPALLIELGMILDQFPNLADVTLRARLDLSLRVPLFDLATLQVSKARSMVFQHNWPHRRLTFNDLAGDVDVNNQPTGAVSDTDSITSSVEWEDAGDEQVQQVDMTEGEELSNDPFGALIQGAAVDSDSSSSSESNHAYSIDFEYESETDETPYIFSQRMERLRFFFGVLEVCFPRLQRLYIGLPPSKEVPALFIQSLHELKSISLNASMHVVSPAPIQVITHETLEAVKVWHRYRSTEPTPVGALFRGPKLLKDDTYPFTPRCYNFFPEPLRHNTCKNNVTGIDEDAFGQLTSVGMPWFHWRLDLLTSVRTIFLNSTGLEGNPTDLFIHLIYKPELCPNLEELSMSQCPEWDYLFIMLERRNLLPNSKVSRIKKLSLPAVPAYVILNPLTHLLRGQVAPRPSNQTLSIAGRMKQIWNTKRPGCSSCCWLMYTCDIPIKTLSGEMLRQAEWSAKYTLSRFDFGRRQAPPAAEPPLEPMTARYVKGREKRERQWAGYIPKRGFDQYERRPYACAARNGDSMVVITGDTLAGLPVG